MFQILYFAFFLLALGLFMTLPKVPLILALFGALIGAIGGASIGIARTGDAVAGTLFLGLVTFIIVGLLARIYLATSTFGATPHEAAIPALWRSLSSDRKPEPKKNPSRPPTRPKPSKINDDAKWHKIIADQDKLIRSTREPTRVTGEPIISDTQQPEKRTSYFGVWFSCLLLGAIIVGGIALDEWGKPESFQENQVQESQPERTDPSPEDLAHDRLVTKLERENPEIDPTSASYDADLVRRIARARDRYVDHGLAIHVALRRAFNDVYEAESISSKTDPSTESRSTASSNESSPTAYPDCVIKGVMTDADYRACGIEPPQH